MKNKIKRASLIILAFSMISVSCAQNVDPTILTLIQEPAVAKDPTKGSLSGSVELLGQSTLTQVNDTVKKEITIKVIRDEDILDPNDKKKVIESKGKTISSTIANENGQFFIPDINPGKVSVILNGGGVSSTKKINIEKGKVNLLENVILGNQEQKSYNAVDLNITGKVVKTDGTPVAGAKVSDFSGGFVSTQTVTGQDGTFVLKVTPFSSPKNLEISSPDGKQVTSYVVESDNIENLSIPLLANTRPITGKIIDFVTKKPVEGVSVNVSETRVATITDSNGVFKLKGVPTTPISLSIGNLRGYIDKRTGVPESTNSIEQVINDIELTPLGNLQVNIVADNSLVRADYQPQDRSNVPFLGNSGPSRTDTVSLRCPALDGSVSYYYSNSNIFLEPQKGKLQIEGTDIVREFEYPVTPTMAPEPKCFVSALESFNLTVYLSNRVLSIPVEGLPGGEYTLSVNLPGHETQKGIRVMVPSRDTLSTEVIQLRTAKRVFGVGDISGKIIIRDSNGNVVSPSGLKIKVVAISGELDLRIPTAEKGAGELNNNTDIRSGTQEALINAITNADAGIETNNLGQEIGVRHRYAYVDNEGRYLLTNVPSGSRVVVAAVIGSTDGKLDRLDENYSFSSYSLINVVSNSNNSAGDIIINKRSKAPEDQPSPEDYN